MLNQIMGNLPSTRVQPARPFVNTGVDFCGPLWVHFKIRGKKPQKCYVAVFCCFSTKAVHLELVSDLTTAAFIGALKRFMSRRGRPKNVYCDNATNFVGAKNQLGELQSAIYANQSKETITSTCSGLGIEFHFIPPRAPHFGGLWEAAVKSAKHLLQRSAASASLTYEELETVITQIEAILNSRPITPLSSDPNDLTALTPGHFLIGEPLNSTIDSRAEPIKASLHTRWKLVDHLKDEFWRRWTQEYLNELQQRTKWKSPSQNIKPGDMVIIREDNVDVMKWPLGRIVNAIPGDDGYVRVADVKTATGIFRRSIHRLAPLPCNEGTDEKEPNAPLHETTSSQIKERHLGDTSHTGKKSTDRQESDDDEAPMKKKRRNSLGATVLTLLLASSVFPSTKASQIEVKKFDNRPGLRFDKMGITNLVLADWDLIVYYDLHSYWLEYAALVNGTNALQHICDTSGLQNYKTTCIEILNQIRHIKDEIDRDNELLCNTTSETRHKRGVVNIVGNVANALFGVLDSEYAEQMAQTIDTVKQNEDHLLILLKNQTSIVDSTINIMKRDQLATQDKFKALDNQLIQIIKKLNDTGREYYIYQQMVSLSVQLSLIIVSLQRIQSSIIDVLTDIRHGKISPLLLSPHQLSKEVTTIKNHLPASLRLPAEQNEILHLYQLMTVKGRVVKNHVIFQVKLPLISSEGLELYKVLPIPFLVNNTMMMISPHTTYLAVSAHRDKYYPLSEQELASCTIGPDRETYLCYQHHPTYRRGADINKCEVTFLNDSPDLNECQMKKLKESSIWLQTANPNQWIYTLRDDIVINAVCDNEVFSSTLEGSGLLTLGPNCVVKHDTITIQGHQKHQSRFTTSYEKLSHTFNMSITPATELTLEEISNYRTQWKELSLLQEQLSAQHLELPKIINSHTSHHSIIGYVALGVTIIIAAYLMVNLILKVKHRKQKTTSTKPTPRPRTEKEPDFSVNIS